MYKNWLYPSTGLNSVETDGEGPSGPRVWNARGGNTTAKTCTITRMLIVTRTRFESGCRFRRHHIQTKKDSA